MRKSELVISPGLEDSGDDTLRMTVVQAKNGDVTVMEHDIIRGTTRVSAKFPAEKRKVQVREEGSGGMVEAVRDTARIRAMVYAQLLEDLVNSGKVDLG